MMRIQYNKENNKIVSELLILDGEFTTIEIDKNNKYNIIKGDDVIHTEQCNSLKECKRKARKKLIELGLSIETEVRNIL